VGKHTDFYINLEIFRGSTPTSLEKPTPPSFKLLFGEEAVTPEEIKFKSTRTTQEVVHSPTEAESKDMLESDRLKVAENLHAYHVKMKVGETKR
jgi:hypothetical protein